MSGRGPVSRYDQVVYAATFAYNSGIKTEVCKSAGWSWEKMELPCSRPWDLDMYIVRQTVRENRWE